jgi:ubiquitin-conjugating enzyme E2 C
MDATSRTNAPPATLSSAKLRASASTVPDGHSVAKRLQSELMQLMVRHRPFSLIQMANAPGISAFPKTDSNLLEWLATIEGPPDSVSPPLFV